MGDRRTMILGSPHASALTRFRKAKSQSATTVDHRLRPRRYTRAARLAHRGIVQPGRARDLANAQRSAAGWVTARDRLHGRVVDRRSVVEMAPAHSLDTVVNGRATDPDPRAPARVSAFSPTRSPLPAGRDAQACSAHRRGG